MCVKLIGIEKIPLIKEGDDLAEIIINATDAEGLEICNEDVFVIAETAVAKSEGNYSRSRIINPL